MLLVSWVLTWGGIRTICCYIHGVLQIHLRLFLCMLHSSVGSVSYMVSGCGGSIIEDKINFFFFNYEKKNSKSSPCSSDGSVLARWTSKFPVSIPELWRQYWENEHWSHSPPSAMAAKLRVSCAKSSAHVKESLCRQNYPQSYFVASLIALLALRH